MKRKKADRAIRGTPQITVHNRQRAVRLTVAALQEFAGGAFHECLKITGKKRTALATLPEINVILVSDRRMAELHRRFLGLPGPTDVITFQHGEILVSAETARRQARHFGTSLDHELHLYIAHGLLHLHGFDDKDSADAMEMARAQEKLVASVLRRGSV